MELSTDGGATWTPAELGEETGGRWAWRRWSYDWDAVPGRHVLMARATDADGNTQPAEHRWNHGGFADTAPQRVPVTVTTTVRTSR